MKMMLELITEHLKSIKNQEKGMLINILFLQEKYPTVSPQGTFSTPLRRNGTVRL